MYNTMMLMVACILVAAKGLSPNELDQVRQEWMSDEGGAYTQGRICSEHSHRSLNFQKGAVISDPSQRDIHHR